jgi:hypothetical protein
MCLLFLCPDFDLHSLRLQVKVKCSSKLLAHGLFHFDVVAYVLKPTRFMLFMWYLRKFNIRSVFSLQWHGVSKSGVHNQSCYLNEMYVSSTYISNRQGLLKLMLFHAQCGSYTRNTKAIPVAGLGGL